MADPKVYLIALSASPAPAIAVDKDGIITINGVEATDPAEIGSAFIAWAGAYAGNQNKVRPWMPELKNPDKKP